MTKLSRKDRYMNLRTSIDEATPESAAPLAPEKNEPTPRKAVRQAAPDAKGEHRAAPVRPAAPATPAAPSNPVLEDLLGEVTQYNLNNGDLVSSDTQMQILHDLSESGSNSSKRTRHLEKMELNEFAGGTTRNLYSSDLSTLANKKNAAKTAPALIQAKVIEDDDDLDLGIFEPDRSKTAKPAAREMELSQTQQSKIEAHLAAMQQEARKPAPRADTAEEDDLFEDGQESASPISSFFGRFKTRKAKEAEVFEEEEIFDDVDERSSAYIEEEDVIENPAQEDADLLDEEILLTVQSPKAFRSNAGITPAPSPRTPVEEDEFDDEDEGESFLEKRARKKAEKARAKAQKKAARAKAAEEDEDDLLDLGGSTQEFERPAAKPASRLSGRKKPAPVEDDDYDSFDDEDEDDNRSYDPEDHSISKGALIFMIVMTIILIALITATVYGMSMLGIFG